MSNTVKHILLFVLFLLLALGCAAGGSALKFMYDYPPIGTRILMYICFVLGGIFFSIAVAIGDVMIVSANRTSRSKMKK